jgi:RimJ/RimL family protein N-acetyltransferase
MQLVTLAEDHLVPMADVARDPAVLRFTRFPDPPDPDFLPGWLARYQRGRSDGTCAGFAALDGEGAFLGVGLAPHIDQEGRELELGYLVVEAARGRGVARWIVGELTRWAFEEVGALRATLIIDVENHASQRVAERCGYTLEGVLRSCHLKGDRRTDQMIYSRLPTDDFRRMRDERAAGVDRAPAREIRSP